MRSSVLKRAICCFLVCVLVMSGSGGSQMAFAQTGQESPLVFARSGDGSPEAGLQPGDSSELLTPDSDPEVPPSVSTRPAAVRASNAADAIALEWDIPEGADACFLYRKGKGDADWSALATLEGEAAAYLDQDVTAGGTYSYRLRVRWSSDGSLSEYSPSVSVRRLLPPVNVVSSRSAVGVLFSWNPAEGAGGYRVYRRGEKEKSWTLVAALASGNTRSWTDASAANSELYRYAVASYGGGSESVLSSSVRFCHVAAPSFKSFKRKGKTSYEAVWAKNTEASGYQIQYSTSSVFSSRKTVKVQGAANVRKVMGGASSKKTYYARVRAYLSRGGKTYYSAWSLSPNARNTRGVSMAIQKRGSKAFELRAQAKQKMYGYDTVQGSCSDGTYGYYCLYNRKVEKCKIVKVKLSSKKVVKVSGALAVSHGNDMAYDAKRARLVVAHCTGAGKRLSLVNPGTLKVEEVVTVSAPKGLAGASESQRRAISGYSGIAYNEAKDQYVALLNGSCNFLLLDGDLRPLRYVSASYRSSLVYQGIDATDDYVLVAVSPRTSRQSNAILVFTWEGAYVGRLTLKGIDEVESIYHVGSKFYASVYRSYHKTYYTKQKKTVKVKGKKKVRTVKVRHRVFTRDNYIYNIKAM